MNCSGQSDHQFPTEDALAAKLSALSHPARLAILRHLSMRGCSCCKDVVDTVDLAQSTVSQHLKVLKEAGLISFRRDGVRSSYVLNPAAFAALHSDLEDILALVAAPKNGAAIREAG